MAKLKTPSTSAKRSSKPVSKQGSAATIARRKPASLKQEMDVVHLRVKPARLAKGAEVVTVRTARKRPKQGYGELVKSLAKEFGVKVGPVPTRDKNPYRLPSSDIDDLLRRAGVLTKSGALGSRFK